MSMCGNDCFLRDPFQFTIWWSFDVIWSAFTTSISEEYINIDLMITWRYMIGFRNIYSLLQDILSRHLLINSIRNFNLMYWTADNCFDFLHTDQLFFFLLTSQKAASVACRPLVPKFAGSNPTEAVEFFRAKKILITLFVPCRIFAACKRTRKCMRGSRSFRWKLPAISRPSSSSFHY